MQHLAKVWHTYLLVLGPHLQSPHHHQDHQRLEPQVVGALQRKVHLHALHRQQEVQENMVPRIAWFQRKLERDHRLCRPQTIFLNLLQAELRPHLIQRKAAGLGATQTVCLTQQSVPMISPKDRTADCMTWNEASPNLLPFALIDVLLFTHPLPVSNLTLCELCRN